MAHHELALHAVKMGVDLVPDSVWHKIPYFRPSKQDEAGKDTSKEAIKKEAQPFKHHHRRRTEGHNTKRRKDTRRRAHSSSPYAGESSDDEKESDGHRYVGRGRQQTRHDDKYAGSYRNDPAYAAGFNHAASLNAAHGLHVNTEPHLPAAYNNSHTGPSPTAAAPAQYSAHPPHPVS